ncbi:MAG TPA: hypothetical protein GXX59_11090 [Syntrophomonadaceae bacterium]|nr:hypothetical protein [Syntrophomonadaceae bacterium]
MENKRLKIIIITAVMLCIIFPVAIWASGQDYIFMAHYIKDDKVKLTYGHNVGLKVNKVVCECRIGGTWEMLFSEPHVGNFERTKTYKPSGVKNGQKIQYKMKFFKGNKIVKEITAPIVVWGDTKSGSPAPPPPPPPEKTIAKPDWAERLAASIIAAPAKWLLGIVGLYDPIELVFGDFTTSASKDYQKVGSLPYLSTFTESEWNALTEFYSKVNEIVPIELVLVVVFMGIAYWYSATKPDAKVSFRGCVAGLLIAMLLLRMGGMMFSFLFDVNKLLVGQFYSAVDGKISEGASFLTAFISLKQDGYIGSAVLFIIGVFAVAIINWQYIIRKVMIALLIGLLPVVAVISVINRESLIIWFRELIANIFLQASHAAVLAFLIVLGKSSGSHHGGALTTSQFWFTLVALISIPSISVLIRKLFGAEGIGTGVGRALAAGAGLGSLVAVGRALGGGSKKAPVPAAESAGSSGGLASRFAVKGGKTLAGAAGGLAGGMIAGPGGMVLGGALASKGAGLFSDTASSLSNFISKAKSEGTLEAMGLVDDKQLLDPGSMYDAGQTMLGSNVFGKSAGTVMAAGAGIASRLPAYKDSASVLRGAQEQAKAARASIPELRSSLSDLTSQKKIAEARYDHARSLYGPKSEKMQWAQEKVSQFEGGVNEANKFVTAYDRSVYAEQSVVDKMSQVLSENPDNTAAANRLNAAQDSLIKLQEVEPKVNDVRSAVEYIDKSAEYRESKSHYEDISAQEAQIRMQLMQAERQQTRDGMKDYFENIRH